MLVQLSNFANNATSLEKSLRMVHALLWIAATLPSPLGPIFDKNSGLPTPASLLTARAQLATTRRFFRLFKWIDSFVLAFARFGVLVLSTPSTSKQVQREKTRLGIEMAKFTLLGCYTFTEMWTITNMIGLTRFAWGGWVQREADKFWLYAIVASIVLSLFDLATLGAPGTPGTEGGGIAPAAGAVASGVETPARKGRGRPRKTPDAGTPARKDEKEKAAGAVGDAVRQTANDKDLAVRKGILYKALVVDCCDVFIPGFAVGWIRIDSLLVGFAMSVSTAIVLTDMWRKAR